MTTATYERSWQGKGLRALDYLEHLDGVDWFDAPVPRRWHRCWTQTRGRFDGERVERCACGAIRLEVPGYSGLGPWINRNERRRRKP